MGVKCFLTGNLGICGGFCQYRCDSTVYCRLSSLPKTVSVTQKQLVTQCLQNPF